MNISLLHQLREAGGGFVPIDALGPSREANLSDIQELAAFGFMIEHHPYRGAAYLGPAERLCPDQIEYQLGTHRIGRRIAVWNRVASTNDLAAHAAATRANEGLVVLAEEQSAGRGRRGRTWSAPPQSSVLMSALLFPTGTLAEPAWLTALAAVAVAEVVAKWTGRVAAIKWPNDIRVDGRKVAGILVERGAGAVIGIGLNANSDSDQFPAELRATATSLRALIGRPIDRSELVRDLIQRLDDWYEQSERNGADVLNSPWRDRSEHLGRLVRVSTPSAIIQGRLDDLDLARGVRVIADGGQSLQVPAYEVVSIATAGD